MRAMKAIAIAAGMNLALILPREAPAQAPERMIIVLDVSGSMGGKVRGERKIDIARRVIGELLGNWSPSVELGLIAYGHRRKGDCGDIEVVVPIGKVDTARFAGAMKRLRPVGMTPLTAAVRRAAETLRYSERKATVILVSDGAETCKADPCALGRELKSKGVDFVAHVIGFDVKAREEQGLKCLAEATGGLYVSARDANQLHEALRRTVKQVEETKPKPAPPPKADMSKNNVRFVAVYSAGGEQVRSDIEWSVQQKSTIMEAGREKAHYKDITGFIRHAEPVFSLAPGNYRVNVKVGNATASQEFTVMPGAVVAKTIVLDAGAITLRAEGADGAPVKGNVEWYVERKIVSGELGRQQIDWRGATGFIRQPEATVLLNAGEYRANLKVNEAPQKATSFTVEAGKQGKVTVNIR